MCVTSSIESELIIIQFSSALYHHLTNNIIRDEENIKREFYLFYLINDSSLSDSLHSIGTWYFVFALSTSLLSTQLTSSIEHHRDRKIVRKSVERIFMIVVNTYLKWNKNALNKKTRKAPLIFLQSRRLSRWLRFNVMFAHFRKYCNFPISISSSRAINHRILIFTTRFHRRNGKRNSEKIAKRVESENKSRTANRCDK